MPKFAFKCQNCGRLEEAGNAGERALPAACPSCGAGVSFDPATGVKTYADRSNWTVLAELSTDELAEHGLKPRHVTRHRPTRADAPARAPEDIRREAAETLNSEDVVE